MIPSTKIKFEISAEEDMKTAYRFLGHKSAGVNFSKNITNMLPALEGIDKNSESGKRLIGKEVCDYYEKHENEIKDRLLEVQTME